MALIAASMSSLGFAIAPLYPLPVQSSVSPWRLYTAVRMQGFANDGEEVKCMPRAATRALGAAADLSLLPLASYHSFHYF